MLLMFLAIVPGATFPGVLAAFLVNKIFFTVMGTLVYVYLFVSAGEAFDTELGWIRAHGVLLLLLLVGAAALVVVLVRVFWRRLKGLWAQAKQGGKILESPRAYATRVLLPQILSYAAKIGVIAVFLAAYSIPVTFNSVTHVMGSTSAATVTTVTPGGVGVTQAANAVALRDYTDPATATAYSLTQELVTTATNVVLALILVLLVFGWTGGEGVGGGVVHRREGEGAHHARGLQGEAPPAQEPPARVRTVTRRGGRGVGAGPAGSGPRGPGPAAPRAAGPRTRAR